MDKNNIFGFILIFLILIGYSWFKAPTEAEIQEHQRLQDSVAHAAFIIDSLAQLPEQPTIVDQAPQVIPDSVLTEQLSGQFGVFAPAAKGTEKELKIENDVMIVTFTNKGGRIKNVEMKDHKKLIIHEDGTRTKVPLQLLEDTKNKFEYILPINSASTKEVFTGDLYFQPQISGKTVTFKAITSTGGSFEQIYTINDGYLMDYNIRLNNLGSAISRSESSIRLNWVNYLDKLEKEDRYEASYSSIYFKEVGDDPSYCSCRGEDEENLETPVKWVSHAQQFFNTSLIATEPFKSAKVATTDMFDPKDPDLKRLTADIQIPLTNPDNQTVAMQLFSGPNHYNILKSYNIDLEDIIPFGWSIFGWVNRHVIRPMFEFLAKYIGNYGIVILILTIILKTVLYPLQYKMLYSQVKMRVLKPELAKLKERIGDDAQKLQMEQMKLYRETGASPFSGCLPVFLQMPVWIALYRFFPAAVDFRQKGFLWADDLSSYDEIINFGVSIWPLGSHLSLFTILWIIATLAYTYYNSKDMDFTAQPMMKYIQYFMPLMFIFIFNSYASGLTCYLFFSSLINISQIIITKNFIIDHDKVRAEIAEHRKKPKKAGFAQKLEKAMKDQQAQQARNAKKAGKKSK